jgi:hypothetical protein
MTFDPSAQPGAFENGKALSADELRQLRAQVWADGAVSSAEAEKLFDMNRSVEPSKDWTEFFVEALCEFILSQSEPRGYVTEDEASWLLRHISRDGRVETRAELELIVKLLEHAEYAPPSLRRIALGAIEQSVLTGEGATRAPGDAVPGRVDDGEVALIRRLIFAPAGDGPAKVSAAEAEMLFRLKDASLGKDNSPEWKKLFVQGVANHLMAHQNYTPPSPTEELRLEAPYKSQPFGHVLSKLGSDLPRAHELHDAVFGENQHNAIGKVESEVAADAEVTANERDWLQRFYDQDGQRDEYEQALLDFLAEDRVRPF